MADEKPQMVQIEALEAHSAFGKDYQPGDKYEIDERFLDSVVGQGKAKRVSEAAPKASAAKPSQPVEPMTTDDFKAKK